MGDGFVRRYEVQNLTDGYVADVAYPQAPDKENNIIIFSDKIGVS